MRFLVMYESIPSATTPLGNPEAFDQNYVRGQGI